MRKKINVIVILLLAMCLLTLVACQPGRDSDGLIKLKTPKNLALSGSALSWDEVEHAERYYISVGEEEKAETTSTTYDLSTIVTGYGDFSVTVRAYGDGETYGTSDKSDPIVYHKGFSLDTPIISVDSSAKTASWQSVENAAEYSVAVYNSKDELVNQTTTAQTSYSFADKTDDEGKDLFENFDKYRITVIARPDQSNDKYSNSLMGSAYYFHSTTLDTPKFTSLNSSRIQWGSVTNAKSYTLKLTYKGADGEIEENTIDTTGTSYQRSNFNYDKVGDYFFTVKANGDSEVFYDSAWSEESEDYKVSKLQGVEAEDVEFVYDNDGKARLTWSIDAGTSANQFYLSLKGLLPDGTSKLENSETSMTVSCNVVYVTGKVYDLYKYANSDKKTVEKAEGEIVVYNMSGDLKVRYNNVDYFVKNSLGDNMRYASYVKSSGVDIVFHDGEFVYNQNVPIENGESADQSTDEDRDLFDLSTGNRLCYFEEDASDENIEKSVLFNADHEPVKYVFAIDLDTIFIKEVVETPEEGDPKTTYEYNISDSSYYGILYNISVSAGHSSNNYVASSDAVTAGRYMSYKIPNKNTDGVYEINNAGEYAYIVLKNFIDAKNGIATPNNYKIMQNINFNGYEIAQIDTLKDNINGNFKTLSNLVVGNSQLTEEGVVEVTENAGDKVVKKYSMFLNVAKDTEISDAFYMGIGFVGYEKEDVENSVGEIYVAPIAINNYGSLNRLFVQSDSIKADSAYLAGVVINNYSSIYNTQVYAELSGRIVAGIAINNKALEQASAIIYDSGFYGSIDASVGEFIQSETPYIAGAGLVIENVSGNGAAMINNSEAIGTVTATATNLDALYAGGLVAINSGAINGSFSGEYHGVNLAAREEVIANGNNAFAGGLVALNNAGGQIMNSYATNRATASGYVGGFVGLNKGNIESAYAVGGTSRGGINNGAFAGSNEGTISKSAAYSSDAWAQETDYFTLIKQESQLGSMINILYPDAERQMTLTEKEGFRYPVLISRTYTKNYVVEMSPSQIPEVEGFAVIGGDVKEISIVEEDIYGDRSARGNKVVIVLNYKESTPTGGNYVKLIYGKVR
ncbi:MAG: hypothetical protein K2O95_06215 [Clostridia bacterium]|nr:hypothetical protein [Clostridia bacterium]